MDETAVIAEAKNVSGIFSDMLVLASQARGLGAPSHVLQDIDALVARVQASKANVDSIIPQPVTVSQTVTFSCPDQATADRLHVRIRELVGTVGVAFPGVTVV